jgi:hypothetical protein
MKCKIKKEWIATELDEHGSLFPKNKRLLMAKKIATAHVIENGCAYYPALFKLEAKLKAMKRGKK